MSAPGHRPSVFRDRRTRLVLLTIMAGTFIGPLDASIVNIALPEIAAEFSARLTAVGWVASAYLLVNSALILTMGRLGDTWGLRRVYVTGFAVFAAGSLACAFAPSLGWLIAARAGQAFGASMFFSTGPAIIANVFPPRRRGQALGWVGISVSAGLMAGPVLGGLLVGSFGWPSIFLINIPLAAIVIPVSWRVLPTDEPRPAPFDLGGTVLAAAALGSLLIAMSEGEHLGWGSWQTLGLMALAVACGAAFIWLESHIEHPMFDLGLLRNWAFSAGALAGMMTSLAFYSVILLMPFFLLQVRHLEPQLAGLVMAALSGTMAFIGPVAGRISDRYGSRGIATAGLGILALVLASLSFIQVDTSAYVIAGALLVGGGGAALFQAPNTSAVLGETPRETRGVGSAVVGGVRNVGMTLGIAVAGTVVSLQLGGTELLSGETPLSATDAARVVDAMGVAFLVSACVAIVAVVVSWSRGPQRPDRKDSHDE